MADLLYLCWGLPMLCCTTDCNSNMFKPLGLRINCFLSMIMAPSIDIIAKSMPLFCTDMPRKLRFYKPKQRKDDGVIPQPALLNEAAELPPSPLCLPLSLPLSVYLSGKQRSGGFRQREHSCAAAKTSQCLLEMQDSRPIMNGTWLFSSPFQFFI